MIHSCHQALLGVFDDLSSSLLHLSKQRRHTPPETPPNAAFLPPYNTQAAVMTNLMSHLLNQLDRAVLSLPGNFNPPLGHHEHGSMPATAGIFGHGQGEPPDLHPGHDTWRGDAAFSLFSGMEQRQMRVRAQVKAVERLLREGHVP
jgi:hypothetical protein